MAAENSALPSQEYIINVFKYIPHKFNSVFIYFILIVTTSSVEVN